MIDLQWLTDEPIARLQPYPRAAASPGVMTASVQPIVNRNGLPWRDAQRVQLEQGSVQSVEAAV